MDRPGKGSHFQVYFGDESDPIAWVKTCFLSTTKDLQFVTNTEDTVVENCEDPDAPADILTDVTSQGATLTGTGFYRGYDTFKELYAIQKAAANINVKLDLHETLPNGKIGPVKGSFIGRALVTIDSLSAPAAGSATVSLTANFDGLPDLQDAP